MNVLITGGAGYVGMELSYALARQAGVDTVTIYDRLNRNNYNMFCGERKLVGARLVLEEDDILNQRALAKAVSKADVIYHLAAQTPTDNFVGSSHIFEQNNHWGTACLIEALRLSEGAKRVIHVSTLAVYGEGSIKTLEQIPNPTDPYGISKLRGEKQIFQLHDESRHSFLNVRSPIVFGYSKNLRVDQAVNRMVFDAKMRGRVQILGDSSANAPHIYINDLVMLLQSLGDSSLTGLSLIPTAISLSAHEVFESLQSEINGLEAIYVDQSTYASEIQLLDTVDTYAGPISTCSLKSQLSEFLEAFIN